MRPCSLRYMPVMSSILAPGGKSGREVCWGISSLAMACSRYERPFPFSAVNFFLRRGTLLEDPPIGGRNLRIPSQLFHRGLWPFYIFAT